MEKRAYSHRTATERSSSLLAAHMQPRRPPNARLPDFKPMPEAASLAPGQRVYLRWSAVKDRDDRRRMSGYIQKAGIVMSVNADAAEVSFDNDPAEFYPRAWLCAAPEVALP